MNSKLKTFFIQVFIFLLLGEIGSRLLISYPKQEVHLHLNTNEIDEELGWKTKANHSFKDTIADASNVSYPVDYQTVNNGFRIYENIALDTVFYKILFIGDSYTQAVEVSNEKTFYHLLGRDKDLPVTTIFSYGASGYSTFQEYLIFEKYVEEIKPDLVVWQFCSNDFIDNYHQLEEDANYGVGVKRPYLNLKNEIEFQTPLKNQLPSWTKKSRLAYSIFLLKEKMKAKFSNSQESAEKQITSQHFDYENYKIAYDRTHLILKKVKEKLPEGTQLIFFPAETYEPQLSDFTKLCHDLGFIVEQAPAHRLNEAKNKNQETIFTYDNYHWNERGHEVVAEGLKDRIKSLLNPIPIK